jgi:dephospho-CoA kinase
MKVVGIVGLPASGKGEFSRIALSLGIPVIVMGDMIRKVVRDAGRPLTDKNLGETAGRIRAENGMDAIARLCVPEVRKQEAPLVIVDGIRGDSEVRVFRDSFPGFVLVRIDAPFGTRARRIAGRGRPDDNLDGDALKKRDERELAWGLGKALLGADYRIDNDSSLESFIRQVMALLERVKGLP